MSSPADSPASRQNNSVLGKTSLAAHAAAHAAAVKAADPRQLAQTEEEKTKATFLEHIGSNPDPIQRFFLERLYNSTVDKDNLQHVINVDVSCYIKNNINKIIKDHLSTYNKRFTINNVRSLVQKEQNKILKKHYKDIYTLNKYLDTANLENKEHGIKVMDKNFFKQLEIHTDICNYHTALQKDTGIKRKSKVYIYFMRHSESCANVMKKNMTFGKYKQTLYTDPELSYRGEKMAKDMADKFFKPEGTYSKLEGTSKADAKLRNNYPVGILFGASSLIRAQQTSKCMLEAAKEASHNIYDYPNIYKFPYINEVGGGEENTPMSSKLRSTLKNRLSNQKYIRATGPNPEHIKESYSNDSDRFRGPPDSNKSNILKFLDWLGENLGRYYSTLKPIDDAKSPDIFQMIIVTHHGVLKQLMKDFNEINKKETFNNLDGVEISVEYDESGRRINKEYHGIFHYNPPPQIPLSCPESESTACRKPVCGVPYRDQPQSICDLIAAAKRVAERVPDKNRIRNNRTNKKHGSKFITLHASHPIQDIDYNTHIEPLITAIHKNRALFPQADTSNLEKYKKPGYFSRQVRRNMDYLYEDLNDISYAVNCSVAPPAEAAQQPPAEAAQQPPVEAAQQPPAEEAQPGSSKSEAPPVIQSIVPATSSKKKSSPSSIKENNTSPFGSKLPSTKMRPVSPPKSVQPVIVRSSSTPTSKKPKSSENRSLLLSASEVGISSPTKGGATRKKLRKHPRATRKKHRRN